MEKNGWMINCISYIEEHLKEDLTVERISSSVGYSPCYFSRCFKKERGLSPMEYVKQRRLCAAAKEIRQGRRVLYTSLDYGWQTHSGFSKAFRNHFGYSPVLLRALYVRDASLKGEQNMGIYLKKMEQYQEPEKLWETLCLTLKENGVAYNKENLRRIYEIADTSHKGEKRKSGELYITHSLNVAIILADMGADEETIGAGLLHDSLTDVAVDENVQTVLQAYQEFKNTFHCEDDRGALVALADRLHNMRTIEFVDKTTWKKRAEDTMKIFSPIAAKCGNSKLQSELDELSIKHLKI